MGKLNFTKKESNSASLKWSSCGPITQKWLFGLSNLHMGKTKGVVLANVRAGIQNLDVVSAEDVRQGGRNPAGLWGVVIR